MTQLSEIQNHINRYTCAVNRRDWHELAAVFAEQATWECKGPPDLTFEGRPAVVEGLKANIDRAKVLVQMNTPALISVEGTRATAHSTLREVAIFPQDAIRCEVLGMYADCLAQVNGAWVFLSRSFTIIELRNLRIDAGL